MELDWETAVALQKAWLNSLTKEERNEYEMQHFVDIIVHNMKERKFGYFHMYHSCDENENDTVLKRIKCLFDVEKVYLDGGFYQTWATNSFL